MQLFRILTFAFICTSFSASLQAASAKVYVWVNKDGVLVYSDSPQPGAEEANIIPSQNISPSVDTSILDINPQKKQESFEVEITQPEHNATVRDNTGSVHVSGRIKPYFKHGYKTQLYLNNTPYQKPQTHSIFALRNVERGEHKIKIALIDNTGKIIATSKPTTFFMHRASKIRAN